MWGVNRNTKKTILGFTYLGRIRIHLGSILSTYEDDDNDNDDDLYFITLFIKLVHGKYEHTDECNTCVFVTKYTHGHTRPHMHDYVYVCTYILAIY